VVEPNEMIARIHDRMPYILDPRNYDAWMDPDTTDPEHLLPLLRSLSGGENGGVSSEPRRQQPTKPRATAD
jgi:putative SOS response-associated peptidase YedK